MNFYDYIHILSYIFINFPYLDCGTNENLRISKSGIENVMPCAVGMKFFVVVNNTSDSDDFNVEFAPDQCCVELGSSLDCDVFAILGECAETIPKGSTKSLNLVAPIINPYNRKGYCIAFLDSKTTQHKRSMRNVVNIPFDTRSLPSGARICKAIDEDPLNNCQPIDCEVFYNGNKPFYDVKLKRCVAVPPCVSGNGDMPDAVYDPVSNQCLQDDTINKDDLDFIKGLTHRANDRIVKDIVIIKSIQNDKPKLSENEVHEARKAINKTYKLTMKTELLDYFHNNKFGVLFLSLIILLQCGVLCITMCFSKRRCWCKRDSQISTVSQDASAALRADVSMTTPLLGTNAETETTCQFMSESSHVDKKISNYKACQKENAKVSLSDDILSKCVNRRNWDRKEAMSEAVEEIKPCDSKMESSKTYKTLYISAKKDDQNFESEKDKNKDNTNKVKNIVKKKSTSKTDSKEKGVINVFNSERELHCLTYTSEIKSKKIKDFNVDTVLSERELQCHSYNYGMDFFDDENESARSSRVFSEKKGDLHKAQIYATNVSKPSTNLGQMSAQASFSNDSIDDYLSERGMLYLTGENVSKYTFSDSSVKSSVSSRTSKNNIMRHVLSYLKREKHGPASEPGKKKGPEVNLELLHMSKATMSSSSNYENECLKTMTRPKDSRSSL